MKKFKKGDIVLGVGDIYAITGKDSICVVVTPSENYTGNENDMEVSVIKSSDPEVCDELEIVFPVQGKYFVLATEAAEVLYGSK